MGDGKLQHIPQGPASDCALLYTDSLAETEWQDTSGESAKSKAWRANKVPKLEY